MEELISVVMWGLKYYDHERRDDVHITRRAMELEFYGRTPGMPEKTWKQCVKNDARTINVNEYIVSEREEGRRLKGVE